MGGANRSIIVLLMGVAMLSLGNGLHGSLVGVRASAESFSTSTTGLIMSSYSLGLLFSSWASPRIVQGVGHIRVFAAFASVVSSAVLLMPLFVNPVWWFCLRFISGFCTSGLFIVCESWLNSASSNKDRGRLLSIYMIVNYGAMGGGQLLLNVADASGFSRFIIVSVLLSVALVPLTLVPTETPNIEGSRGVRLMEIYKASPLAVVGTFGNGLGQSAFFGMGAVFGLMQGLSLPYISLMMALPPLGVILSQYPLGVLSDRMDRRTVIVATSAVATVVALLCVPAAGYVFDWPWALIGLVTLFGTLALPLYSLVLAHANDHFDRNQVLGASAKLILLYGIGAIAGPSLAGLMMQLFGPKGFLIYLTTIYALIAVFAAWRRMRQPKSIKPAASDVMKVGPVSTPVSVQTLVARHKDP